MEEKEEEKEEKKKIPEETEEKQKKITGVIVGAGARGYGYSLYAVDFPDLLEFVAVADPKEYRRHLAKKAHNIKEEYVFSDWRDMIELDRLADFAIIATQDQDHWEPAVAFANKGYHILLEKPMAVERKHCLAIAKACEENNVMFCVCHVLRYAPHNKLIKKLLEEGRIGRLVNVNHVEPVGYFHFAHSYVRGNWRKEATSTFSLMAKSCHDIDLIRWWVHQDCKRVSSFGSLSEFHPDRKPEGAAKRCLDCQYKDTCTYSATDIYLRHGWFASHIVPGELNREAIEESLRTTQYGVCVWQSDNDVVDNQVVNFEFEGGVTASFSMIAFTEKLCERETTLYGTEGQIRCYGGDSVVVFDFNTRKREVIHCEGTGVGHLGGHGGADFHLMHTFVRAVATNNPDLILTNAHDALLSHLLVFDAEDSRVQRQQIEVSST
eukprot:m.67788 g.67788  ORF g.67788 m.67788 type:complete len:436 (-) comp8227_c2_seq3:266-1573(-)